MRLGRLVGVALATALLLPGILFSTALAHTPPAETNPEAGAVLERPPTSVDVWFPMELDASKPVEMRVVHNLSGRRVDRGGDDPLDRLDAKHIQVGLEPDLPPGRYVVSWVATGVDGHPAYPRSFSFTIAAPPEESSDDLVPLMLAVFGAAGFATSVGMVGYLLRRQLGLVKPPPDQPTEHH